MPEEVQLSKSKEEEKVKKLLDRYGELYRERSLYHDMWQDITDYVVPRRYNFKGDKQRGLTVGDNVFDGTAQSAHDILVSGFYGNILSAQFPWVRLQIPSFGGPTFNRSSSMRKYNHRMDKIPEIRTFIGDYEYALYDEYQRSNFYDVMPEFISDASSIGTSTIYMEEDTTTRKTIYTVCNPGECYISPNKYGKVDTLFRRFKMTVRQLKQKFPGRLPPEIEAIQKSETQFTVIHAVYPRNEREMYQVGARFMPKVDNLNMPWASVYILEEKKVIMAEQGYRQFPYACWRWRVNSEESYGRSPSSDALITILGGNILAKSMYKVAQLAAEPPWNIPSEMRGQERIVPNGRNYYEDKARLATPSPVGSNYSIGKDREDEVRNIIKNFYHVDFFMMLSRAAMDGAQLSVPQVMEMQSEKASVLGTIIGRFASDGLDVINDRTVELATEGGRMPEMPQIMMELFGGETLRYDYIGPLAQMQKRLFRTQGIMSGLKVMGELEAIKPGTMDLIDIDYAAKELLESFGWPAHGFTDEAKVQETRDARKKQIMQEAQVKQAALMSQAVPNLSKGAEANSPMDQMMQGKMAEGLQ